MKYLILTLIWLAEIAIVVLGFNAQWVRGQIDREHSYVQTYVGSDAALQLQTRASETFDDLFVKTGIRQSFYDQFVPQRKQPQQGMENLAPWLFTWMKERIDTWWWMVYGALYRMFAISMWLLPFGPILFAAFVDGFVTRRIRRESHDYANPIRYKAAGRTLLLLAFLPLVFLVIPLAVNPISIPVWIALCALAVMMVVTHTQHRM